MSEHGMKVQFQYGAPVVVRQVRQKQSVVANLRPLPSSARLLWDFRRGGREIGTA